MEGGDLSHSRREQAKENSGQGLGLRSRAQAAHRQPLLRCGAGGNRQAGSRAGKHRRSDDGNGGRTRRRRGRVLGTGEGQQGKCHRPPQRDQR